MTTKAGEAQMTAPKAETPEWLTRAQIDSVIESMSASDLIDAMGDGLKQSSAKMAGTAFNAAAARIGLSNGTPATDHIRMSDFPYMAGAIGEVVNIENPTSAEQSD